MKQKTAAHITLFIVTLILMTIAFFTWYAIELHRQKDKDEEFSLKEYTKNDGLDVLISGIAFILCNLAVYHLAIKPDAPVPDNPGYIYQSRLFLTRYPTITVLLFSVIAFVVICLSVAGISAAEHDSYVDSIGAFLESKAIKYVSGGGLATVFGFFQQKCFGKKAPQRVALAQESTQLLQRPANVHIENSPGARVVFMLCPQHCGRNVVHSELIEPETPDVESPPEEKQPDTSPSSDSSNDETSEDSEDEPVPLRGNWFSGGGLRHRPPSNASTPSAVTPPSGETHPTAGSGGRPTGPLRTVSRR